MADTAKELDERGGPCRYCSEEVFTWEADWKRIGDEVAHLGCIEEAEEEQSRMAYDPDWMENYEQRGN